MAVLSVLIPIYDDALEVLRIVRSVQSTSKDNECWEWVSAEIEPCAKEDVQTLLDNGISVIRAEHYRGLPCTKNQLIKASTSEYVLFSFPGIIPAQNAIEQLIMQLQQHPQWGAVTGCWLSRNGHVERGYNIRQFPTFKALMFDLLLLNKFAPSNKVTRSYKLLDFDYSRLSLAQHANDCFFMARRRALMELGLFDEGYSFGWFDQIEMCQKLSTSGWPVYFDPSAIVISDVSEPLLNRILAKRYEDFYRDQYRFIAKSFGPQAAKRFRIALLVAMAGRLFFAKTLPRSARKSLLKYFRSYVNDEYIQSIQDSYSALLRKILKGDF